MGFRFRSHVLVGCVRYATRQVFGIRTVSLFSSIIDRLVLLGRTESEQTSVWFMDIATALYTSGNWVGKGDSLMEGTGGRRKGQIRRINSEVAEVCVC